MLSPVGLAGGSGEARVRLPLVRAHRGQGKVPARGGDLTASRSASIPPGKISVFNAPIVAEEACNAHPFAALG
jgi:hypothetical protein